jgi:hypothetical protein
MIVFYLTILFWHKGSKKMQTCWSLTVMDEAGNLGVKLCPGAVWWAKLSVVHHNLWEHGPWWVSWPAGHQHSEATFGKWGTFVCGF